PEDHDIFAVNSFDSVYKLINENPFLIKEFGQHTRAFNFYRLIEEDHDKNGCTDRKEYIAGPTANFADHSGRRRGRQCSSLGLGGRDLRNVWVCCHTSVTGRILHQKMEMLV